MPNFDHNIQMLEQKSKLRPNNIFSNFYCPILISRHEIQPQLFGKWSLCCNILVNQQILKCNNHVVFKVTQITLIMSTECA